MKALIVDDEKHVRDAVRMLVDWEKYGIGEVFEAPEGETAILGKAVIVHAQPDDYRSQPTGNAGGRLACGVIEKR